MRTNRISRKEVIYTSIHGTFDTLGMERTKYVDQVDISGYLNAEMIRSYSFYPAERSIAGRLNRADNRKIEKPIHVCSELLVILEQ